MRAQAPDERSRPASSSAPPGPAGRPRRRGSRTSRPASTRPSAGRPPDAAAPGPAAWNAAARRLQQRGPLPDHPLVVGADPGVPRCRGDQQVVEETPPFPGVPLDQRQVLRREQYGAEDPEDLAGPGQRRPVQPHPVRPARIDLDLDQRAAPARRDRRPDDGPVGALADQRRVRGDPVAAQRGDVADRLGQVGLALAVRPAQGGHSRFEHQVGRGIGPEVGEREPG